MAERSASQAARTDSAAAERAATRARSKPNQPTDGARRVEAGDGARRGKPVPNVRRVTPATAARRVKPAPARGRTT
ncbi:MAG: hypothetical protein ACRDVN_01670, partial [Jiangellaceae bacterium]